jgi:hypothetical protein
MQKQPNNFISRVLQHQQDLRITLSNIEPLPEDSMDRILHFKRPVIHPRPEIGKPKRNWSPADTQKAKQHTLDALDKVKDQHVAFTDGSALAIQDLAAPLPSF